MFIIYNRYNYIQQIQLYKFHGTVQICNKPLSVPTATVPILKYTSYKSK